MLTFCSYAAEEATVRHSQQVHIAQREHIQDVQATGNTPSVFFLRSSWQKNIPEVLEWGRGDFCKMFLSHLSIPVHC